MDFQGASALWRAASGGDITSVQAHIRRGADIEAKAKCDLGSSPLAAAAKKGRYECALSLLSAGANINSTDRSGFTPLHETTSRDMEALSQLLILHGANLEAVSEGGETPLIRAARKGCGKCVHILLHASANYAARDCQGNTALQLAAQHGHREVVDMFIRAGADLTADLVTKCWAFWDIWGDSITEHTDGRVDEEYKKRLTTIVKAKATHEALLREGGWHL